MHRQLTAPEEHAQVEKKIYAQLPPKVEYRLTALGTSLIPVIRAIGEWADEHQVQLRAVITKTTDMPEPDTP